MAIKSKPLVLVFTAFVKNWYYETFKKTAEWLSSAEHGKKLPDWKHGEYKKIGGMEIVEFPLIKKHPCSFSASFIS